MKRPNPRILRMVKGEEYQLKGTENIFNKIREEKILNLMKMSILKKVEEAYKSSNR